MIQSIGIPGMVIILVIALILFGPSKLPQLGKAVGQTNVAGSWYGGGISAAWHHAGFAADRKGYAAAGYDDGMGLRYLCVGGPAGRMHSREGKR